MGDKNCDHPYWLILFTWRTLFVEPAVDMVQAGELEENARSHRNWQTPGLLLAAVAADTV